MYSIQNSAHTVEIRGIYILLYNQQVITVQYCTSAMTYIFKALIWIVYSIRGKVRKFWERETKRSTIYEYVKIFWLQLFYLL